METATFKFFPNSLSLFEITKRFFPITIIDHFNEHLKDAALPERYITMSLDSIREGYQSLKENIDIRDNLKSLRYNGYMAKLSGHDIKGFDLMFAYAVYINNFSDSDIKLIKLYMEGEKLTNIRKPGSVEEKSFEEHKERSFFEMLSGGVNMAIFEGYLITLQEKLKSEANVIINNISVFAQTYIQEMQGIPARPVEPKNSDNKHNENLENAAEKNSKITEFLTFESLFNDKADINLCVEALRKVDPPIISLKNKYLLGKKEKGAFAAWVRVLWTKGYIKNYTGKNLAPLLNQKFPGLDLYRDGKALYNINSGTYLKYIGDLTKLLPPK